VNDDSTESEKLVERKRRARRKRVRLPRRQKKGKKNSYCAWKKGWREKVSEEMSLRRNDTSSHPPGSENHGVSFVNGGARDGARTKFRRKFVVC